MSANKELSQQLSTNLHRQELLFQFGVSSAVLWGMVLLPLIPASLSFSAIVSKFPAMLDIPVWLAYVVAIFAGAGIEFLGLSAVKLALRMRKYNVRIAGTDFEPAPLTQGVIIAVVYLLTVVTLTIFLKVFPAMAIWSLLPLAGMGALADWLIALQADHNDREAHYVRAIDDQADQQQQTDLITELKAALDKRDQQLDQLTTHFDQLADQLHTQRNAVTRLTTLVDSVTTKVVNRVTATAADDKPKGDRMTKEQRQMAVLMRLRDIVSPDDIDHAGMAETFGASERTIRRDIEDLVNDKRLVVNGSVKVL